MRTETINLRLAGRGGQGIMLAAFLLAQAATYEGLHVVQTQSYGPEARLGAAKSDVILSPHEIAFPEILTPDILLCLSRDAYAAYEPQPRRRDAAAARPAGRRSSSDSIRVSCSHSPRPRASSKRPLRRPTSSRSARSSS